MLLEELHQKLIACEASQNEEGINDLLCQMIQYIIQHEYFFLLDLVYPWELIDSSCGIEYSRLVIARESAIDGFYLLKCIPMREILANRIQTGEEEVSVKCRIMYAQELISKIPCFED